MTQDQKLLLSIVLLPALADILEDVPMKQQAKMRQQAVINAIRSQDRMYMNDTEIDVIDQQIELQRLFRVWCEETFKNEENGK